MSEKTLESQKLQGSFDELKEKSLEIVLTDGDNLFFDTFINFGNLDFRGYKYSVDDEIFSSFERVLGRVEEEEDDDDDPLEVYDIVSYLVVIYRLDPPKEYRGLFNLQRFLYRFTSEQAVEIIEQIIGLYGDLSSYPHFPTVYKLVKKLKRFPGHRALYRDPLVIQMYENRLEKETDENVREDIIEYLDNVWA